MSNVFGASSPDVTAGQTAICRSCASRSCEEHRCARVALMLCRALTLTCGGSPSPNCSLEIIGIVIDPAAPPIPPIADIATTRGVHTRRTSFFRGRRGGRVRVRSRTCGGRVATLGGEGVHTGRKGRYTAHISLSMKRSDLGRVRFMVRFEAVLRSVHRFVRLVVCSMRKPASRGNPNTMTQHAGIGT